MDIRNTTVRREMLSEDSLSLMVMVGMIQSRSKTDRETRQLDSTRGSNYIGLVAVLLIPG